MSRLPNLWIFNGQYYHEESLMDPQETHFPARRTPSKHARYELYVPAERIKALVELWDRPGGVRSKDDCVRELLALVAKDKRGANE